MNLYAFYLAIAVVMAMAVAVVGWRAGEARTDTLASHVARTVFGAIILGAMWPLSMWIVAVCLVPATRDIIRRFLGDD